MKDLSYLDKFRVKDDDHCVELGRDIRYNGGFVFAIEGVSVFALASSSRGWDHVSVSCRDRCPTWDEMSTLKIMKLPCNFMWL